QSERQPRQWRDRPENLDHRVEHSVQGPRQPQEQAKRGRERDAEEKPLRHPQQAVRREARDALIHLAALVERLEYVQPSLLPRLERRRQILDGLARRKPDQADQEDARQGKQQVDDALCGHDMLWTGNAFAYFSGSFASNGTLSNKANFWASTPFGVTPISFIASR